MESASLNEIEYFFYFFSTGFHLYRTDQPTPIQIKKGMLCLFLLFERILNRGFQFCLCSSPDVHFFWSFDFVTLFVITTFHIYVNTLFLNINDKCQLCRVSNNTQCHFFFQNPKIKFFENKQI